MGRLLSVFFSIFVISGGFFFFRNYETPLLSPIPKIFGISGSYVVNNWFPRNSLSVRKASNFSLFASSALLVDPDSGEVIYQKDAKARLPVASVVKIMTALVALERGQLSDVYTVSEKASKVGENSMSLTAGEKLTLEELLYGLMLVSGNDAAVTIAEGVAQSEEKFVELMNEQAKRLGIGDTKFVNASGLDDDNKPQYSTAYDMAVITRFLWENYPVIRMITSTYHKYIEANSTHKAFDLYNDTNLLTTYPGVRGIKPGFTWEAGLCLVTYAENNGKRLLAVILGSDDRRGEMKELLDYGFGYYGIKVNHPALDL